MNTKGAQNGKWLLHINKNLIDLYHLAHHLSGGVLKAKDIPALMLFLNELRDSDSVLQPIRRLLQATPPMYIPPQAAVFLEMDGWNLIPVSKHLWLVMRWMYDSYLLPYIGQDGQYIMKLMYHYMLEWVEGTMAAKEAQSKK